MNMSTAQLPTDQPSFSGLSTPSSSTPVASFPLSSSASSFSNSSLSRTPNNPILRTVSSSTDLNLKSGSLFHLQQQHQPQQLLSQQQHEQSPSRSVFPARRKSMIPCLPPLAPSSSAFADSPSLFSSSSNRPQPEEPQSSAQSYQSMQSTQTASFPRPMVEHKTNKPTVLPHLTISTPGVVVVPVSACSASPLFSPCPASLSSPSSSTPSSASFPSHPESCSAAQFSPFSTLQSTFATPSSCASSSVTAATTTAFTSTATGAAPLSMIPAVVVGIKGTYPPFLASSSTSSPTCGSRDSSVLPPTSVLPLVGREYLGYYGSLSALVNGNDISESKPRPLSSMEQAESWLAIHAQAAFEENGQDSMMTNSPTFTSTPVRPASVTRLSSDQQSIHPLQVDSIDTSSDLSSSSVPTATDKTQTYLAANIQPVAFTEQPVVRKKTSFASKLRKVFIAKQAVCNNTSNSSHPTNGQVSCMPPPEIRFSQRRDSTESSSMVIDQEHRGSVSSASSMNSAERRGSTQSQSSITPSTSPDMSPIVHSKPHMHAMEPPSAESQSMFGAGMTSATSHDSGIDGPSDSSAQESATSSSSESDSKPSALTLPPTQTRTVKKRLSFASISSFFSPKSNQDQETRAKQQRSSSVPHVENPLISVGRQIASFQRRHSLNDMQEAKKKQQQPLEQSPKVSATSWNKDGTAVSTAEETCAVEDSGDSNPSQTKATNSISATKSKLRLNNVFGKGKKKKAHLTKGGPKLENLAPAKPLRPALVHRSPTQQPQGNAKVHRVGSRRRSSSVRSNQSNRSIRQRNHQRRNSHSEEAGSESNASASGSSTGSSSNSASTGRASLSRKSLEEHQARINSLPPTEQQPHYNQHRHRASRKHRRQGSQASQASLENDRQYQYQQQQQQQQYSSFNSASDCQEHCSSPAEFSHVENGAFASPMCPIKNGQEPTREGALASAPTAIMLPLTSSETSTTTSSSLDLNNSKRPHHVLRNPLSSLSPSSSCCSFASDIEEEDEEDETRGAMHGSSHDRYSSSSTSSSSVQSNGSDRHDRRRTQQQQHQMDHGGDEICEEPQQQAYNPLLPAAAARISVDRIMMENAPAFQPKVEVPASANMYIHPGQEVQCLQEHTLLTSTTSNQQQQQQQQQCLYMQEPDHPHHHQQYYHPDPSTYPPRPPRQLQFSTLDPSIHPTWTAVEYDRTSDANITALRLTPAIAHKIKLELNQFKSQEMEVHEESRVYTHFFV